jgi:hypothetical protein
LGGGYATEAARAALAYGFREIGLSDIVALTVPANQRSRRVMERLGMTHDLANDFDHPQVPEGRLRRHVPLQLCSPGARLKQADRKRQRPAGVVTCHRSRRPLVLDAHCLITLSNVRVFVWVGTHVPVCMHLSKFI